MRWTANYNTWSYEKKKSNKKVTGKRAARSHASACTFVHLCQKHKQQ